MKYSFSGRAAWSPVQDPALARPSRDFLRATAGVVVSDVSADNAQRVTSLINAEGGHAVANVADVARIDDGPGCRGLRGRCVWRPSFCRQ